MNKLADVTQFTRNYFSFCRLKLQTNHVTTLLQFFITQSKFTLPVPIPDEKNKLS